MNEQNMPAGELTDDMVRAGMKALLQCAESDLETYSPDMYETYADEVKRVYVAMRAADRALRPSPVAGDVGMPVVAWRIEYTGLDGPKKTICGHNAVSDYKMIDAGATSTRLVLEPDAQAALAAGDAEIAALTAERDALRKDTDRLDHLSATTTWTHSGDGFYSSHVTVEWGDSIKRRPLRAAIDAAMTKEQK